jgi:hypothetical protein
VTVPEANFPTHAIESERHHHHPNNLMSNTDNTPSTNENPPIPNAPQPMNWEEQKALFRVLVQKKDRTEDEQDFLEAVGMAFVIDDLFSEEETPNGDSIG